MWQCVTSMLCRLKFQSEYNVFVYYARSQVGCYVTDTYKGVCIIGIGCNVIDKITLLYIGLGFEVDNLYTNSLKIRNIIIILEKML